MEEFVNPALVGVYRKHLDPRMHTARLYETAANMNDVLFDVKEPEDWRVHLLSRKECVSPLDLDPQTAHAKKTELESMSSNTIRSNVKVNKSRISVSSSTDYLNITLVSGRILKERTDTLDEVERIYSTDVRFNNFGVVVRIGSVCLDADRKLICETLNPLLPNTLLFAPVTLKYIEADQVTTERS